jgi:hypothetical protein
MKENLLTLDANPTTHLKQRCHVCGCQDETVENFICGYCRVIDPERAGKMECAECAKWKPVGEFESKEMQLGTGVCRRCEAKWERKIAPVLEQIRRERKLAGLD